MPNIMDYAAQVGGLTLTQRPWSFEDSLVLAALSYNDFGSLAAGEKGMALRELVPRLDLLQQTGTDFTVKCRALLYAVADTVRYGDIRASGFANIIDNDLPIQFSAVTLELPDGTIAVAFRGTDNTLTGWREDLHMSFESPVPAQEAAVQYLQQTAARTEGPLLITGHSKGGNLSAYAAAHAQEDVQKRIICTCSYDGPGLDDATVASPGYARVDPVLNSFIPQSSIVGLLMGHEMDYVIVHSAANGFAQHDLFTWQFKDMGFETLQSTTLTSRLTDQTLQKFIRTGTPHQRRMFVDGLFRLLEATDAETMREIRNDKKGAAVKIFQAALDMDAETRKAFIQTAGELLSSGALSLWDYTSDLSRSLSEEYLSAEDRARVQSIAKQLDPGGFVQRVQDSVRSIASLFTEGGDDQHGT